MVAVVDDVDVVSDGEQATRRIARNINPRIVRVMTRIYPICRFVPGSFVNGARGTERRHVPTTSESPVQKEKKCQPIR